MQVITIGIDLAKNVFQVHGVAANDKVVFNKPLRRSQVLPFFAKLAPCLIGMEACASAHYWTRELKKLCHDVRLMPAKDVKAYVKRNKNDSVDAAHACEAVRRPTVRSVPVKTPEQQAQLMQHRVRDLLVAAHTGHQCAAMVRFAMDRELGAFLKSGKAKGEHHQSVAASFSKPWAIGSASGSAS